MTLLAFRETVFNRVRRCFSNIETAVTHDRPPARSVAARFLRAPLLWPCTIETVSAQPIEGAIPDVPVGSESVTSPRTVVTTEDHLTELGGRIRALRVEQGLTLQMIAERTGLSSSMVSMVERGRTSPSIGTLIAISSALGVHMADLFELDVDGSRDVVQRSADHQIVETAQGVLRRLVQVDPRRGLELVVNEYEPGTASAVQVTHHGGYEYGYVLEGTLTVELQNTAHQLEPGDSIAFESTRPHRIVNEGRRRARAVWVNLSPRPLQVDAPGDGNRSD